MNVKDFFKIDDDLNLKLTIEDVVLLQVVLKEYQLEHGEIFRAGLILQKLEVLYNEHSGK
jgi:hypothetical protein